MKELEVFSAEYSKLNSVEVMNEDTLYERFKKFLSIKDVSSQLKD
jgi:hypothetical protein